MEVAVEVTCHAVAAAAPAARSVRFHAARFHAANRVEIHAEAHAEHQHAAVLDAEFLPLPQPLKAHQLQKMLRHHLQKTLLLHPQKAPQRRNLLTRDCAKFSTCEQAAVMPPVFMRRPMSSGGGATLRNLPNLRHPSVACRDRQCHDTIELDYRQHLARACTAALSSFRDNTN